MYTHFCQKPHAVLLATDVAARGLDFTGVEWVVQADCPEDVATYIHRTGRTARYTAKGRALLMLLPSEAPMVNLLQQARIPLRKLSTNASKVFAMRDKLQALLSSRAELKYTAQRAFVSYVRSVHLQANKEVFDASALPLAEYAASLGLLAAPRVRLTGGGKLAGAKGGTVDPKKGGTNWAAAAAEAEEEGEQRRRAFIDGDDDGSDDDGSDGDGGEEEAEDDDDDDELLAAPKKRKSVPRNKLMRQLERHTQGRGAAGVSTASGKKKGGDGPRPLLGGDADADADADDVLAVKQRHAAEPESDDGGGGDDDDAAAAAAAAAAAKKKKKKLKIRKGGTVEGGGKHTTFDDDGVALHDRLAGGFADVAAEKAESEGADGRDGRIASVRSLLQQTAADDRARERERVRSKHQLQKKRRREAEEAVDGGGGGGGGGSEMVLEAAEDDGTAALLADDSDGEYDGPRGPAPPRRAGGAEHGKKKRKSREAEAAALLDSLLGK